MYSLHLIENWFDYLLHSSTLCEYYKNEKNNYN